MKSQKNPLLQILFALTFPAVSHGADLIWNAALPDNWNTSNTNWSGATWSNTNSDNAYFYNANGTVNLTTNISAGSLSFINGGVQSGFHELRLTGSNLSLGSINVSGGYNASPYNGGVDSISDAYNQRLRFDTMSLNVSGDSTVRRGMLYLLNSTANFSGAINSNDAWNVFRSDSSTVTVSGGINLSTIASAVELYGGTVQTPFIKVGNALWDGQSGLFMGGGVNVLATQNTSDFIQVYNNGDTNSRAAATLSGGVTTFNTSIYAVTIATQLNGNGSLTKTGSGTLTINQSNNYTGGTTVNQGMLVLAAGAWTLNNVGGGPVTVGSGATLRADNSLANQLNGLILNGGTVEAINSNGNADWGNFFLTSNVSSSGTSHLSGDIALRASNVDFNVASGGILNVGGTLHGGYQYGNAGISKSGEGKLVVSGTHSYSGATTVSTGTLIVNGNISTSTTTVGSGATLGGSGTLGATTVNGSFAPGNSIGIINFAGTLDLNGISNFEIDPTLGVGFDRAADLANVTGTISYGGILNVLYGGSASDFTTGMTFNLFDATLGFTDSFTTVNLPTLSSGLSWQNDLASNGSITVVPESNMVLLSGLGMIALLRRKRCSSRESK